MAKDGVVVRFYRGSHTRAIFGWLKIDYILYPTFVKYKYVAVVITTIEYFLQNNGNSKNIDKLSVINTSKIVKF